jgi:hypothetical protein
MSEAVAGTKLFEQALAYGPSLIVSVLVAETFYKFGSFSIEFVAWAATFGCLVAAQRAILSFFVPRD